jgi:type IV pilus assembly protein PilV
MLAVMKKIPIATKLLRAQRGVALIECMVALLIFSFGVLGLVGLEARAINFSVDAEDRNRASVFGNEIASQMWLSGTISPTTVAYNTLIGNIANVASGGLPNGTVTVTPLKNAVNSVGVPNVADIKITWQPPQDVTSGLISVYTTRVVLP